VSKVLGLGVRGIGLAPTSRSSDCRPVSPRSGFTAGGCPGDQLGLARIAVSITHEREYALAVAFGVRTAGGRYVFPLDIEERLGDREEALLRRMERIRGLGREAAALTAAAEESGDGD